MGQLVPAPPGTGLRDSPGRARRRRVAPLICIADATLLPSADGPFLCRLSPCRSPGRRVPGWPFRPLASVLLTHDEITVALKSRRDAGPVQPGDRGARPGPGIQAAAWQFASVEKRTAAGNGISWPLVTTRSARPAEPGDEGGTQPKLSRKRVSRATAHRSG